jgi:hypothetical protein
LPWIPATQNKQAERGTVFAGCYSKSASDSLHRRELQVSSAGGQVR